MGCANSVLLLALQRAGLLEDKRFVIFEPEQKVVNDRTFCFWLDPHELKAAGLEELISYSWSQVRCPVSEAQDLEGKQYYYLRSEALYKKTKDIVQTYNGNWIHDAITDYNEDLAKYIFDSRPPKFANTSKQYSTLVQSFYGWVVNTEEPVFDPFVFTMMDFSIPQIGHTQFLYVLPFTPNRALIEPTRFGVQPMTENEATQIIERYLAQQHTNHELVEREKGCIPMCSAPITCEPLPSNWLKTGAGAGLLKPSTGYSFVRNLQDAKEIVNSIQQDAIVLARRQTKKRFIYYDRLLLQILERTPQRGKAIFEQLFAKNKAIHVLEFLDENTNPLKELRLMLSLPISWFLTAALRDLIWMLRIKAKTIAPALLVAFLCFFAQLLGHLDWIWPLLLAGFFFLGLPHGALDHLHQVKGKGFHHLARYFLLYIALGTAVLSLWLIEPTLALLFFLAYSAWHFGQADLQIWKENIKPWWPIFWGAYTLFFLLSTHHLEVIELLSQMGLTLKINTSDLFLHVLTTFPFWLGLGLIPLFVFQSWRVFEALLVLVLLSQLPILEAFAVFFIFQHSLNGWRHLTAELPYTTGELWRQALPFTIGSIGLFAFYYQWSNDKNWGLVFMFLSALSFPHVYFMHRAYKH